MRKIFSPITVFCALVLGAAAFVIFAAAPEASAAPAALPPVCQFTLWCHTEPNGNQQTLCLPDAALQNAGHVDANGNPLHAGDHPGACEPPEPYCGDGTVDEGEACDDGNNTNGDGCSASCTIETPEPYCGDGTVDAGEACDDGNTTDGDGCSSSCTVEPQPVCGNSILESGEGCDDGNTTPGDGCSASCQVETQEPICGNSILESGEACDDGNTTDGDGCSASCTIETPEPYCGDGTVDPGESCDDGNNTDGDGCSASCTTEQTECPAGQHLENGTCVPDPQYCDPTDGQIKSVQGPLPPGALPIDNPACNPGDGKSCKEYAASHPNRELPPHCIAAGASSWFETWLLSLISWFEGLFQ